MLALMRGGATHVPAAALVVSTPLDLAEPAPARARASRRKTPAPHASDHASPDTLQRLDAIGLTYHFGRAPSSGPGIDDISFTLRRGELTVVTGRVGAGRRRCSAFCSGCCHATQARSAGTARPSRIRRLFSCRDAPRMCRRCRASSAIPLKANILLGAGVLEAAVGTAIRAAVLEQDVAQLTHGLDTWSDRAACGSRVARCSARPPRARS